MSEGKGPDIEGILRNMMEKAYRESAGRPTPESTKKLAKATAEFILNGMERWGYIVRCKCGFVMDDLGTAPGGYFLRWCPKCGRIHLRGMAPGREDEVWREPEVSEGGDREEGQ